MKAGLDDFLIFAQTERELLHLLRRFLGICRDKHLVTYLTKYDFFKTEVTLCDHLIDPDGFYNQRIAATLAFYNPPPLAGELCEYTYAVRWVAPSIPNFSAHVALLRSVLESAYETANGNCRKKAISNMRLAYLYWSVEHSAAFSDLHSDLHAAICLANHDPALALCVYIDVSNVLWAGLLTQCAHKQLKPPKTAPTTPVRRFSKWHVNCA